jgi:AAA+ superfamily predicted ATPase
MAKSEEIVALARAALSRNVEHARAIVKALAANSAESGRFDFAKRLESVLASTATETPNPIQESAGTLHEVVTGKSIDALVLDDKNAAAIEEFINEHRMRALLESNGLAPRHRVMLTGAPGNGKTSLAEVLAHRLQIPMYVVRYDALFGRHLGDTAKNLRILIDFVSSRPCLVFFDEFDTAGKERADNHDTGEAKRIVSSLLLCIDSLPSTTVIVAATNHPEMLDRAMMRRFQLKLELRAPTKAQIVTYLDQFESKIGKSFAIPLESLASRLHSMCFSDLEALLNDVHRKLVLSSGEENLLALLEQKIA